MKAILSSAIRRNRRLLYSPILFCGKALATVFNLLPLKKKIVATAFYGNIYGDNPACVFDSIHKADPDVELVWIASDSCNLENAPEYVRIVNRRKKIKVLREYCTAKIWLETHNIPAYLKKRKKQLYINLYHAGLGFKKIGMQREDSNQNPFETLNNAKNVDYYVSDSEYRNKMFRTGMGYRGPILKLGCPRNDILYKDHTELKKNVNRYFGQPEDAKMLLYAPTFRQRKIQDAEAFTTKYYDIDFSRVISELEKETGEKWYVLLRVHPIIIKYFERPDLNLGEKVINAAMYPSSQDLLCTCDFFISDYSSMIFDASFRNIPCFLYAKDYAEYNARRGLNFDLRYLPFPFSENTDELMENLRSFDTERYQQTLKAFYAAEGLVQSDHASDDAAKLLLRFLDTGETGAVCADTGDASAEQGNAYDYDYSGKRASDDGKASWKGLGSDLPLVSIVVPVYNSEKHLRRCVDSVLAQTYKDVELVLIDDGSWDTSPAICDEYAASCKNVRVFHQENKGISASRNRGVKEASGDYVFFMDNDDYVDPITIEQCVRSMKMHHTDIVVIGRKVVNDGYSFDQIKKHTYSPVVDYEMEREVALTNVCSSKIVYAAPWGKLYKKELLFKHPFPEGRMGEDIATTYLRVGECDKITINRYVGYYWIQHNESARRNPLHQKKYITDVLYACEQQVVYMQEHCPQAVSVARKRCVDQSIRCATLVCMFSRNSRELYQALRDVMQPYNQKIYEGNYSLKIKIGIKAIELGYLPMRLYWGPASLVLKRKKGKAA